MNRDAAISRALSLHPDVPGAGRLCQELLADLTGQPLTREAAAPSLKMKGGPGGARNPWGRKGKPK